MKESEGEIWSAVYLDRSLRVRVRSWGGGVVGSGGEAASVWERERDDLCDI